MTNSASVSERFFIREYGQKKHQAKTLVFIHGLLGWGLNWSPVIKYFESDFHILTYDQRGHGRSMHQTSAYTTENYAQDLKDILDFLEIKSVHLVGHSMGARTAQAFSVIYPGRTTSLVLEDMGPQPEVNSTLATQQMILNVPIPFASKNDMDLFFESEFKVKTASEDTQKQVMANFLKANLLRQDEGKISWRFHLDGVLQTLEQGLKPRWSEFRAISVPTLILKGQNSKHLTLETFNLMLQTLPHSEGHIVSDVGHWIHYQAPEVFSQYVLKFLRDLS